MRRFFYQRRGTGKTGLKTDGLWFSYRGSPVYLIGSGAQALFPGGFAEMPPEATEKDARAAWLRHLDRLAETGINLVRLSPWAFCWDATAPPWACPYPIVPTPAGTPARYDLARHHEPFFDLMRWLCRETHRRDLFLLLALFEDASLAPGGAAGGPWMRHPFHALCGGPCAHPADFYDLENGPNRALQEAWARRVFAATQDLPHVLYDLCSEVGASAAGGETPVGAWLRHHLAAARRHAPGHLLAVGGSPEVGDEGSAEDLWHGEEVDLLLFHQADGRAALCREKTAHQLRFYARQKIEKPRLLGEMTWGGPAGCDDERKHLWVALANGGHAACAGGYRLSRTPSEEGSRALGDFLRHGGMRWWEMCPVDGLLSPDPGRAYAIGNAAGGEYLIYFLERPTGHYVLTPPCGVAAYVLAWVDPFKGEVVEESPYTPPAPLATPAGGADIALWIRRQLP